MPMAMAIMASRRKRTYRGPPRRRAAGRGARRVTPTPNQATILTFPLFCCARFAPASEGASMIRKGIPQATEPVYRPFMILN